MKRRKQIIGLLAAALAVGLAAPAPTVHAQDIEFQQVVPVRKNDAKTFRLAWDEIETGCGLDLFGAYVHELPGTGTLGTITYGMESHFVDYNMLFQSVTYEYTPQTNYLGEDVMIWKATDFENKQLHYFKCTFVVSENQPPQAFDTQVACGNDRTTKIILPYTDVDSRPFEMRINPVDGPSHGTIVVGYGPSVYYTPVLGYEGEDSFTWTMSEGAYTTVVATCTLNVGATPPSGTSRMALIVNESVYDAISNELARLEKDLRWEGHDVFVHRKTYADGEDVELAGFLKYQYTNHNLRGVILIGRQAEAVTPAVNAGVDPDIGANDRFYCIMDCDYAESYLQYNADIWLTRLRAHDLAYSVGGEAGMLKRALDANHYYRTGQLRYPHRAHWGGEETDREAISHHFDNYHGVWPAVLFKLPYHAYREGCSFYFQVWHGLDNRYGWYSGQLVSPATVHNDIFRASIATVVACYSHTYHNAVHHQIFTRHGGCVLSGNDDFDFVRGRDGVPSYPMEDMLLQGASLGEICLAKRHVSNRPCNGDLSVQVMPAPPNALPSIASLTASKMTARIGEDVVLTVSVSDPDAADHDSPYLEFEHRVEWYMNGWDYGRNDPTCITDDTQTNWTQVSHAWSTPGIRKVRALVMDEWRAVAWKEISITVVSDPPVASNDTAETAEDTPVTIPVLANDSDPAGDDISLASVADPVHGTATIDGTNVVYTPDPDWNGTDVFTYTLKDQWDVRTRQPSR